MSNIIDLGQGHHLRRVVDSTGTLCGFVDEHLDARDPRRQCGGSVPLANSSWAEPGRTWTIEQEEPLTLSPSLLCTACGDHGWVRDGKWIPA